MMGNYMIPAGTYSISAKGGAEIILVSITAEMQYLKEGVWTDFDPPQVQKANANAGSWAVSGWQWIQQE
jgi:hypothetical protein